MRRTEGLRGNRIPNLRFRWLKARFPFALLFAFAGGAASQTALDVQWAPELGLKNRSEVIQRLRIPFELPLTLHRAGQSVRAIDCASLLQYRTSGFKAASDPDAQVVESMAVDCRAIQALQRGRPPRTSYLRAFHLDLAAMNSLPPDLAPVLSGEDRDNVRKADSMGLSWKQFDSSATASVERDALVVLSSDIRTGVKICARGDFNRDGIDDLLVRVDTAALHGTYRGSRLFLLTRMRPNAVLKLVREIT